MRSMDAFIKKETDDLRRFHFKTEIPPPRTSGLKTHRAEPSRDVSFPFPIKIDHATSFFKSSSCYGCTDLEVAESVPEVVNVGDGECEIHFLVSLKVNEVDRSKIPETSTNPTLVFEHQIYYRGAEEVSIEVTG